MNIGQSSNRITSQMTIVRRTLHICVFWLTHFHLDISHSILISSSSSSSSPGRSVDTSENYLDNLDKCGRCMKFKYNFNYPFINKSSLSVVIFQHLTFLWVSIFLISSLYAYTPYKQFELRNLQVHVSKSLLHIHYYTQSAASNIHET